MTCVTTAVLKIVRVMKMLNRSMKEKKSCKCDIFDYRYSQKSHMIRHAASVQEGKKPFNVKFARRAVL